MFLELLNSWAVSFDLPILDWIQANMANPFLDTIMPIITVLGDAGIFWMIWAAALLFFKKYRRIGFGMAIAMALGLVVCNMILKPTVGRIRPYDYQLTHFGVTIHIDDAGIMNERYFASFINNETVDEILNVLNAQNYMKITRNGKIIHISHNNQ